MKPIIAIILLLAAGCSTTRTAVQSEIELDIDRLARTGKLHIRSPKDVDLENVQVRKTGTNYTVTIGRYKAAVSSSAVEAAIAESQARAQQWAEAMDLMRFLADKAAASQGVTPSEPSRRSAPTRPSGSASPPPGVPTSKAGKPIDVIGK